MPKVSDHVFKYRNWDYLCNKDISIKVTGWKLLSVHSHFIWSAPELTMFLFAFVVFYHFGLVSLQIISMPLKDNMQATLKADLDVKEMNKYLQTYIQQEVKKGVENALTSLVGNMVQNQTANAEMRLREELVERQHYAFFVTLSTDKNDMEIGTVIIFDRVSLNIGNAYNGQTGKFTCEADGIYVFSWTTLSYPKKDSSTVLIVNGNKKAGNIVDNDETADYLSSSSTVIVNLKKGDLVWIEVFQIVSSVRASSSMFSGFKIN